MGRISDIELLKRAEKTILSVRKKISHSLMPETLSTCFRKIGSYLEEMGEIPAEVPYICFHDMMKMDENNMDIEIIFEVAKKLPEKEDIKCTVIPEEKTVSCMYQGGYDKMMPVYEEIMAWAKDKGCEIKGDSYETYYNGMVYPQDKLLTRIIIPLK